MTAEVVSLKNHRMNNPKRAVLEMRDAGKIINIRSPDGRHTFLGRSYGRPLTEEEFDELITGFKKKYPKCRCIDF